MKKSRIPSALLVLLLFGQTALSQQKSDSLQKSDTLQKSITLQPISWSDTITRAEFNEGVINDPLQLILGKEPGAEVFKAGSDPTVPSTMMIRGVAGINSEQHPLYVIDGVVGGDLFLIPPQEIESVKILKNLSETSFYGVEGTPGVVLVTTKKGGKNRRFSVNFNTAVSLSQTTHRLDLLTADDMRQQAKTHPEIEFTDGGASTDWQKEVYRTTVAQTYQLAVGGTLKNTTYRLSFDHYDQPGNVKGTDRNMTGGSVSISQTALKNRLQVDGQLAFYRTKSQIVNYPSGMFGNKLFYQLFTANPTDPVYTPGGAYYQANRVYGSANPVALVNLITNQAQTDNLSAGINAAWEIWKGLGVKVSGSYAGTTTTTLYDQPAGAYQNASKFTKEGTDDYSRYNLLAGITYKRNLGKYHAVDLFAGYVLRSSTLEKESLVTNNNYPAGKDTITTQTRNDYSLLATLNYSFRQKYFLGVVINQEHDKSSISRTGGNKAEWGQSVFYPGVTASWQIGREGFMKKLKAVSTLVLKAGYGIAGARPPLAYLSLFNPGYTNNELMVEKTTEFTASVEAGFFGNRLLAEFTWYNRTTGNAIIRKPMPVPPYVIPYSYQNGMSLVNSGFEIKVMARVIDKAAISWNSILGFSSNKNRVASIEDDISLRSGYIDYLINYTYSPYVLITSSGNSILAFNLPVATGEYSQGEPVYEKEDGGYTTYIDRARREISSQVYPDFILSWTNSFSVIKSIDVSMMFQYVAGHRIFNGTRMYLSDPNNYLQRNTLPDAGANYDEGVWKIPFSSLYLENASYLRLENLSVGYTYSPKNLKWKGSLRVYLTVNNLFTITGYSGPDPSFNFNSQGIDNFNTYPKTRSYTLGINLNI